MANLSERLNNNKSTRPPLKSAMDSNPLRAQHEMPSMTQMSAALLWHLHLSMMACNWLNASNGFQKL